MDQFIEFTLTSCDSKARELFARFALEAPSPAPLPHTAVFIYRRGLYRWQQGVNDAIIKKGMGEQAFEALGPIFNLLLFEVSKLPGIVFGGGISKLMCRYWLWWWLVVAEIV